MLAAENKSAQPSDEYPGQAWLRMPTTSAFQRLEVLARTACKTALPGFNSGRGLRKPFAQPALRRRAVAPATSIPVRHAAFKAGAALLYANALARAAAMFPGSSVVEQPAVNRLVAGSNPARGAKINLIRGGSRDRDIG